MGDAGSFGIGEDARSVMSVDSHSGRPQRDEEDLKQHMHPRKPRARFVFWYPPGVAIDEARFDRARSNLNKF